MPKTISEERLRELEQLPVGIYYKDLLEKELGISLAEYRALIAAYREQRQVETPPGEKAPGLGNHTGDIWGLAAFMDGD